MSRRGMMAGEVESGKVEFETFRTVVRWAKGSVRSLVAQPHGRMLE